MSGGGGSTTTVQNNAPPPEFMAAYQNVIGRAQDIAGTPYQPYQGNLVAPFSPDQLAGMSAVQNSVGIAAPYINSAADLLGSSAETVLTPEAQRLITGASGGMQGVQDAAARGMQGIEGAAAGFNPGAVAPWMNPYNDAVVRATQNLFAEQNAQAANELKGNAVASGAFGGNREAVAQGVLAGQRELAQAPVLAGLQSAGYDKAMAAAQAASDMKMRAALASGQLGMQGASGASQIGLDAASKLLAAEQIDRASRAQAGAGMAGLGSLAQNTTLTGANALMGIGGMQQQQAQQLLNIPYQQWQAELAYPLQMASWLSGISTGMGGAAGGSSSTTTPGPSAWSQIGGAGLAAASLLGKTGAFGGDGWLSNAFSGGGAGAVDTGVWDIPDASFAAKGGRIPRRAYGGMLSSSDVPTGMVPALAGDPDVPDVSVGYIPATAPGKPLILNDFGSTSSGQSGGDGGKGAMQAIGTIASIAGMIFSDRRLKEDISRVGKLNDGTPIYRYRYNGDPEWHIGFIADELEKHHPEAVGMSQGYGTVNTKAATDASARGMTPANDRSGPSNDNRRPREAKRAMGGMAPVSVGMVNKVPHLTVAPIDYSGQPQWQELAPEYWVGMRGAHAPGNPAVASYLNNVLAGASYMRPAAWQPEPKKEDNGELSDDVLRTAFGKVFAPNQRVEEATEANMMPGDRNANGGRVSRADGGDLDEEVADEGVMPSVPRGMTASAPKTTSPWDALLYAGLGMMGGSSPNAGVNIGRGAIAGLEAYDRQRRLDENAAYRLMQMSGLADYRKTMADFRNKADKRADEAATRGAAKDAATLAIQQEELALKKARDEREAAKEKGIYGSGMAGLAGDRIAKLAPKILSGNASPDEEEQFRMDVDVFTKPSFNPMTGATIPGYALSPRATQALDRLMKRDGTAPAPSPAAEVPAEELPDRQKSPTGSTLLVQPPQTTPQQVDRSMKFLQESSRVRDAVSNLRQVLKETGGAGINTLINNPTDPKAQKLITAYDRLQTVMRSEAFANTGVMQPGEMRMMSDMLLRPDSWRGAIATPEAIEVKLSEFDKMLTDGERRAKEMMGSMGKEPSAPKSSSGIDSIPEGAVVIQNGVRYKKVNGKMVAQ